jgi:hypothetical protein
VYDEQGEAANGTVRTEWEIATALPASVASESYAQLLYTFTYTMSNLGAAVAAGPGGGNFTNYIYFDDVLIATHPQLPLTGNSSRTVSIVLNLTGTVDKPGLFPVRHRLFVKVDGDRVVSTDPNWGNNEATAYFEYRDFYPPPPPSPPPPPPSPPPLSPPPPPPPPPPLNCQIAGTAGVEYTVRLPPHSLSFGWLVVFSRDVAPTLSTPSPQTDLLAPAVLTGKIHCRVAPTSRASESHACRGPCRR